MRKSTYPFSVASIVGLVASCTSDPTPAHEACTEQDLEVSIVSAPLAVDGSVTISGRMRFAPEATLVGGGGTGTGSGGSGTGGGGPVAAEKTVHDLYVGSVQVDRTEFNFRSFAVTLQRPQLCAYAAVDKPAAELSVRVYLYGDDGLCTFDSPQPLTVPLPEHHCSGTTSSTGSTGSGGAGGSAGGNGG